MLFRSAMLTLAAQKARAAGFTLMIPPVLVRPEVMSGTGFLGEHAEEIYYLERDDLYLVGTSEVALAGYHQDEIIILCDVSFMIWPPYAFQPSDRWNITGIR